MRWFFVPKGQEDSGQGFNPGPWETEHPWRRALVLVHIIFSTKNRSPFFAVDGSPIAGTRYLTGTTKIRAVWDDSSSRRDRRIQPRVSTLGDGTPVAPRPLRAQDREHSNMNILCIDNMAQSLALVLVHIIFLYQKSKSIFAVDGKSDRRHTLT